MPRRHPLSLTCAYAERAVDFINLPSCRAGTYFRYAAKVSKDAPKGKGKPFRAVSLFPLETLFPSAESRIASARQACGVSRFQVRKNGSRAVGIVAILAANVAGTSFCI